MVSRFSWKVISNLDGINQLLNFYFIIDASINGEPLESDDIIGVFRNGVCVGYRNWLVFTPIFLLWE